MAYGYFLNFTCNCLPFLSSIKTALSLNNTPRLIVWGCIFLKVRKKAVVISFIVALLLAAAVFVVPIAASADKLPNQVFLTEGNSQTLDFGLPWSLRLTAQSDAAEVLRLNGNSLAEQSEYALNQPLTISTGEQGTADLTLNLLGLIPIKNIKVTVSEEKTLYPGGQSIGVMLYTNGALVVGCSDITTENGKTVNPASEAGLLPGDIIEQIGGETIKNADHLSALIQELDEGQMRLTVRRDGELKEIWVTPVRDAQDGSLRLGIWVRDSTAGVGTLTFYDPQTGAFAGLGHAITDVDTGKQLTVKEGEIIQSEIIEVVKGAAGEPGELKGYFDPKTDVMGIISKNTDYGIYGKANETPDCDWYCNPIQAAARDEVEVGPATLLCTLNSEGVRAYTCRIVQVNQQSAPAPKSFVVEITDEKLLSVTGGIVQGMSGSPVIQNGKLVGAVTHVFVNDPTKGYGIYLDWMLNEASVLPNI